MRWVFAKSLSCVAVFSISLLAAACGDGSDDSATPGDEEEGVDDEATGGDGALGGDGGSTGDGDGDVSTPESDTWACWLGDSGDLTPCTCWPNELEPFPGSLPVGESCEGSIGTDFECCIHRPDYNCECAYAGFSECASADPDHLVDSCPPE